MPSSVTNTQIKYTKNMLKDVLSLLVVMGVEKNMEKEHRKHINNG